MKPNPHRETDLFFDNLIVGSSIQAMVTAYKYQIPIMVDVNHKPLPYYFLPAELDLSGIDVENKVEEYQTLSGNKEFRGMQQIELWNIMAYRLGIMGLLPMYGKYNNNFTEQIPIGNNIRMFTIRADNKIINVHSDNTVLFDYPKNIYGNKMYMINDYIELDKVYDFPKNLYFVSEDCDFNNVLAYETIFFKDKGKRHKIVCKSIVSEELLDNWRNSQISVKLKVQNSIFWNLEKDFELTLLKREISPIMIKMAEPLDKIIDLDIMDEEIYVK